MSATMFFARSTSSAGTSSRLSLCDPLHQVVHRARRHLQCACVHSTILVHPEIGVSRLHERVVLRRLDVKMLGIQDLSRDQRLEESISQPRDILVECTTPA